MPTWERKHESEITGFQTSGGYDASQGRLTITRKYEMTSGEMEQAIGGVDFVDWCFTAYSPVNPENYTSNGNDTDGNPIYSSLHHPVSMFAVAFTPTRRTANAMLVDVEYEGHKEGWIRSELDLSNRSVLTILDLNRNPVGAKMEGVQRILPVFEFHYYENFGYSLPGFVPAGPIPSPQTQTLDDFTQYIQGVCLPLYATCNENGWPGTLGLAPSATGAFSFLTTVVNGYLVWKEGAWQYMGPRPTRNRDGSFTIAHVFRTDLYAGQVETRGMHQTSWWRQYTIPNTPPNPPFVVADTRDQSVSGETWPVYVEPSNGYTLMGPKGEHLNYMYPVAGKTTPSGLVIPSWGNSFRFSFNYPSNGLYQNFNAV